MKTLAAVLETVGAPTPYRTSHPLVLQEIDLDAPGPGEVLVRITAASICHSDLSVLDGVRPRPVPMVLGHEATGVVEQTGEGATGVAVGDHVVFAFVPSCGSCVPCQSGRPALCEPGAAANAAGTLLSGQRRWHRNGQEVHHHLGVSAFAQHTVVAAASVVPVPADLPAEVATLFGCATLTGIGAILNTAAAEPGSSVAVLGLGGVGLSAVMGARASGCHPIIAVDPVAGKRETAKRLGADNVIEAGPDVVDAVREITGGGVEYAIEAVGSAAVLGQAYAMTRRGGTTVAVGLPRPDATLTIPASGLVGEERRLVGSYMGSASPRRDVPRYIRLYRAGLLPVDALHTGTLPLERINEGMDTLASGEVVRQVLEIPA